MDIDSATIDLTIKVDSKKERRTQTDSDLEETKFKNINFKCQH